MKNILLLLFLFSFCFAQKTDSFTKHKYFDTEEFIDESGLAIWYCLDEEGTEICSFKTNKYEPFIYSLILYEDSYPDLGIKANLIELDSSRWQLSIIDFYTQKRAKGTIIVTYLSEDEILLKFNDFDKNKIAYKELILSKNFSHLD